MSFCDEICQFFLVAFLFLATIFRVLGSGSMFAVITLGDRRDVDWENF